MFARPTRPQPWGGRAQRGGNVLQESITISNMQRRRRMQDGGELFVGKSDGCVGSAVEGAMPKMICPHQTI